MQLTAADFVDNELSVPVHDNFVSFLTNVVIFR